MARSRQIRVNDYLIRKACFDHGLSISAAAAEIGISHNTLTAAIRGHRLQPAKAKRIADFCGVLPSEIWPEEQAA